MRACFVKQPSSPVYTRKSVRWSGPDALLDEMHWKSLNLSLLVELEMDVWAVGGHDACVAQMRGFDLDGSLIRYLRRMTDTVPQATVPLEEYDIVMTMGPIFSDEIVASLPNTLFCYQELEHRSGRSQAAARKPWGKYDLFLDHYMRPMRELKRLPQSVGFPYLANPDIMRCLIGPTNEPAVFIDSRHLREIRWAI